MNPKRFEKVVSGLPKRLFVLGVSRCIESLEGGGRGGCHTVRLL